jgi:DHA2 family methylenomycin A resistance protein-like MFS transporter
VALLGFFVITLDALVVSVALPAIAKDLGGGITGLQWVVDGYTLMFAALLLFAGSLSDRIGARRAFGAGLALFVAASAACALAPAIGVLVAARLVQGAGAAVMTPPSLALIREAYHDSARRARAVGIWGLGGALASAVGPLVGGALSLISWRLIFFLNLPVGAAALLLLMRVQTSPRRPVPFDWTGQAAALVGMTALVYALIQGGHTGFTAPLVLAVLALAVAAFAVFLTAQARGAHPMLPLDLFRSRSVVIAQAVGFAFMGGYYGMVFLFSLYYQQQRHLTPLATGLAFLPMTLLIAATSVVAGRAAARVGAKLPTVIGQAAMTAGLLALSLAVSFGAPTLVLAVLMIPVGLGGAVTIPAVTALLLDSVPAERAGTASGALNTSRQVGGALAIAVYGALLATQGFHQGLRTSLLIAGLLLAVTTVASLTLRA